MPWFGLKNLIRMAVLLLLVSAAAFFWCRRLLDPLKTNVGQTALGSMSQEQKEAGGILGGEYPAGGAVCLLGKGFLPGRYGDFPAFTASRCPM